MRFVGIVNSHQSNGVVLRFLAVGTRHRQALTGCPGQLWHSTHDSTSIGIIGNPEGHICLFTTNSAPNCSGCFRAGRSFISVSAPISGGKSTPTTPKHKIPPESTKITRRWQLKNPSNPHHVLHRRVSSQ